MRRLRSTLSRLPLAVRVPLLAAAVTVLVAAAISQVVLHRLAQEQAIALESLTSAFMDGLSTTVTPGLLTRDSWETFDVLDRAKQRYEAVHAVFMVAILSRIIWYSARTLNEVAYECGGNNICGTVRFTERAVVTTFGKAGESSVKTEPGLGFKWPYPIQSVTKYDTRQRYSETRSEALATADNRQIIVQSFIVWEVKDPLKFFQALNNTRAANQTLERIVNEWVEKGWELDRFEFVTHDGSRRPAMAFVMFTSPQEDEDFPEGEEPEEPLEDEGGSN